MKKTLLEILSVGLLAIGVYFCLFMTPNAKKDTKESDSYLPSTVSTTTTTTKPVFKGIEYQVSFTELNEDIHLTTEESKNTARITTEDLANTKWRITNVNNAQGNQCYLYSQDEENAFIVSLVDGCTVTRPAVLNVTLNNVNKQIKVFIGD